MYTFDFYYWNLEGFLRKIQNEERRCRSIALDNKIHESLLWYQIQPYGFRDLNMDQDEIMMDAWGIE